MIYSVYAITNRRSGKIYIGHTSDLEKRIARHNKLLPNKNISFTSKNSGLWEIFYSENFNTRPEAVKREKQLKSSRGRDFLKKKMLVN